MITFESVAQLSLAKLAINTTVSTRNFHANGDSGGSQYRVILSTDPSLPATLNEVSDITLANGNVAQLIHNGTVSVKQFGAIGDGVTDDYAALVAANLSGAGTVTYPLGTFEVTDTVPFRSRTIYEGAGAGSIIHSAIDNKPVCASESWVDSSADVNGGCTVRDLQIRGEKTNTGQIALIIRDYFSNISDVNAVNCGGGGIHFSHLASDNVSVSGSLVENKIQDCTVRTCGGVLYHFGNSGNLKITDGFFINCIAHGEQDLTTQFVFCGQSAGWVFEGFHTYGAQVNRPVEIVGASNTTITDFYIESFVQRAITLGSCQGNTVVSGGIKANGIDNTLDDVSYLFVSRSGISPIINVNASLNIDHQNSLIPAGGMRLHDNGIHGVCTLTIHDNSNDTVTDLTESYAGTKDYISLPGKILPTFDAMNMKSNGFANPICWTSERLTRDVLYTVDLPLPTFGTSTKLNLEVTIIADQFDTGGTIKAIYKALVMVTTKFEDVANFSKTDLIAPGGSTGFDTNPTFSLLNTGTLDNLVLRTTLAFTGVDATGVLTAIAGPKYCSDGVIVTPTPVG